MIGEVEVDESFFGGKEANKHADKKLRAGRGTVGKQAVLGMRERRDRRHNSTHDPAGDYRYGPERAQPSTPMNTGPTTA